jgi:hypothetical protein
MSSTCVTRYYAMRAAGSASLQNRYAFSAPSDCAAAGMLLIERRVFGGVEMVARTVK